LLYFNFHVEGYSKETPLEVLEYLVQGVSLLTIAVVVVAILFIPLEMVV
jgi:hypothetical protein